MTTSEPTPSASASSTGPPPTTPDSRPSEAPSPPGRPWTYREPPPPSVRPRPLTPDYAAYTSSAVTSGQTYGAMLSALCTQIYANADAAILNESEGLDVYISVLEESTNDFITGVNTTKFAAADEIAVFVGFKKKSSPACVV